MGKAKVFKSAVEMLGDLQRATRSNNFANRRGPVQYPVILTSHGAGPSGADRTDTNAIKKDDPHFIRSISFEADTFAINNGDLDITNGAGGTVPRRGIIFVTPQSGTTDVLETIKNERDGEILILMGIQGNTITIRHNHNNADGAILLPENVDFELDDDECIILVNDVIQTNKYRMIKGHGDRMVLDILTVESIFSATGDVVLGDNPALDLLLLGARITTDMLIDGRTIKAFDGDEIGFQVTNDSISKGSRGTIQVPGDTTTTSSANTLNTLFGNGKHCISITHTDTSNPRLRVRMPDGTYAEFFGTKI